MGFYNLPPEKRVILVEKIEKEILDNLQTNTTNHIYKYFSDNDTYIRKIAYLAIGRLYSEYKTIDNKIIAALEQLLQDQNEKVRQTVINALGEIGKTDADKVLKIYEQGLKDSDHTVRNAIIGSLKKMGEKNPKPVLQFAKKYMHDPNPEVRRQVLHGIELRGRTYPEDVLPLLKEVQNEQNRRVRNIIVHVLGQISYKKGCLEKVVEELKTWQNKEIVSSALAEILETHKSYEKFSIYTHNQAKHYISKEFKV
jgi:HEAT repeat protein